MVVVKDEIRELLYTDIVFHPNRFQNKDDMFFKVSLFTLFHAFLDIRL